MLLEYILALNGNFMIRLYFKGFCFLWCLDMAISSNQRTCKTEDIASSTCPIIMALAGDSITSKISADC